MTTSETSSRPRHPGKLAPRRTAAVLAGKASATASRLLGKGGGTALPGLIATRLDPSLVEALAAQLPCGSIVVSGTNGKTTTSRMLGTILSHAGYTPLRNESGSNLMRGVAATLVREAHITGNLSSNGRRIGLFEVDEAALPSVLPPIMPAALLLLDLFRDQLDRYGEVATVARLWTKALAALPATTAIIANADDPLVAEVASQGHVSPLFFGLETVEGTSSSREHASDVKACPRCGKEITYTRTFLGHLGHYRCVACSFSRSLPTVTGTNVQLHGVAGSSFDLVMPEGTQRIELPLPGLYNVYNAVAAAAAATCLGVNSDHIAASLAHVTAAFGRMERLEIEGKQVYIALAKNPAGLNEVLRTLTVSPGAQHLMVMLSDNTADGRDVSWIWDADVEMMAGHVARVIFAGTRAEDMALRFKYAGVIGAEPDSAWEIASDTEQGFRRALEGTPRGATLFIIPTYTAMLDVRRVMTALGHVPAYWET